MIAFILLLAVPYTIAAPLDELFSTFDSDKDKKITVDDKIPEQKSFKWKDQQVKGTYQLSILAQELKYQQLSGKEPDIKILKENPVDRISRSIRERYWDGLTRRIDKNSLLSVIKDSKTQADKFYLYIPETDQKAFEYYKQEKIPGVEVIKLQGNVPDDKHGLLSLAIKDGKGVPYVVPGGRFNEMYGWDSYFHTLGVLIDDRPDLAKGMIDNFVYEITHYGKILNANRTYYLTRSQPPFLTSMIRALIEKEPQSKGWVSEALSAAIKEYETIWMGKERLTDTGLSRYAGFAPGIPPEVEPGHFAYILKSHAKKHKMSLEQFKKAFNEGKIKDEELKEFFYQDRAVRESGHDTTYRWRVKGKDRASDFVTVDLNSLLYKYEMDIAFLIEKHFKGSFNNYLAENFVKAANKRKELMMKYLWNDQKKMFFDYNWVDKAQSNYISATSFYPLWAGIVDDQQAKALVKALLPHLEQAGGISATAKVSLEEIGDKKTERQWDYPNGWAPHQILAWEGLRRYGLIEDADRLTYKWLEMITRNAMDYNGTIPEKYNVVSRSHKVFAEYGNVGTEFSYITLEGFGWMNASYQVGLRQLSPPYLKKLKQIK